MVTTVSRPLQLRKLATNSFRRSLAPDRIARPAVQATGSFNPLSEPRSPARRYDLLDFWFTAAEHELEKVKWPTDAPEEIPVRKTRRTAPRVPELRPVA